MRAKPLVTAIAAMDQTGLIGDGMQMPWHLPRDLKRFRQLTLGKPVILGRRTFQSLGAPLPGRLNIVLSRAAAPPAEPSGYRIATSIAAALQIAESYLVETGGSEVMIIGGGIIYEATSHLWDRLLLTVIQAQFAGDTYFPIDHVGSIPWQRVDEQSYGVDARNRYPHRFLDLWRADVESTAPGEPPIRTINELLAAPTILEPVPTSPIQE